MKGWLTILLVMPMLTAAVGGCHEVGVPEEWCGLSAAALWATGILGLTALWAPLPS